MEAPFEHPKCRQMILDELWRTNMCLAAYIAEGGQTERMLKQALKMRIEELESQLIENDVDYW